MRLRAWSISHCQGSGLGPGFHHEAPLDGTVVVVVGAVVVVVGGDVVVVGAEVVVVVPPPCPLWAP